MDLPKYTKKDITDKNILGRYTLLVTRNMSHLPLKELGLTIGESDHLNINTLNLHSATKLDWLFAAINFSGQFNQEVSLKHVLTNGDDFNHSNIWTARGLFAGLLSPSQQEEAKLEWVGWGKWLKRKKLSWEYLFLEPDALFENKNAKQASWFTGRLPVNSRVTSTRTKDESKQLILKDKVVITWVSNLTHPSKSYKVGLVPKGSTLHIFPYLWDYDPEEVVVDTFAHLDVGGVLPVEVHDLPDVLKLKKLLNK